MSHDKEEEMGTQEVGERLQKQDAIRQTSSEGLETAG